LPQSVALHLAPIILLPICAPALRVFQFSAKLNLMEYRGIRYTIRAGIERGQWFVVIHPDGIEVKGNKMIFGKREDAESLAHRMINGWLQTKSRQRSKRTLS
jgi:hypothetical protein